MHFWMLRWGQGVSKHFIDDSLYAMYNQTDMARVHLSVASLLGVFCPINFSLKEFLKGFAKAL